MLLILGARRMKREKLKEIKQVVCSIGNKIGFGFEVFVLRRTYLWCMFDLLKVFRQ